MTGITSYGAYIPQLRLNRMSIFQAMGWFAPAIIQVAQGERSVCNWDEDALTMAVEAARDCLRGHDKSKIDALFLASTTFPFADRQNAGIAATALNLRANIETADFGGALKCCTGALINAIDAVKSGRANTALVAASDKRETKTASFYELWFGDGAASVMIGKDDVIAEFIGSNSLTYDFPDHYRGSMHKFDYTWEERWMRDEGYSKVIPEVIKGLLSKCSLTANDISKVIFPCFFKREHQDIAKKMGFSPDKLIDNLHEVCGETGSAHPLVMLAAALEKAKPGDKIIVASFGQGSDALLFEATQNIKSFKPAVGLSGSLARKRTLAPYEKFLKFRDLLQTEMGIRAESGTQTAMSTLWRKRKMIIGLVGGVCKKCGTKQYPANDICANPDCRAVKQMDDFEFSEIPAKVKTFTGDMLAVSIDPPSIYGLVQFEGGGRLLADFTDCSMSDVAVGQEMRMNFRKRLYDKERGFHGYFWKAVPQPKVNL